MKFEWDEAKRQTNLRKHRLDFADAETLFESTLQASQTDWDALEKMEDEAMDWRRCCGGSSAKR